MAKKKDPKLEKAGVKGYNKPKRTPNHKTKSHVVVAKVGDKTKIVRFGQQGVKGAGSNPKTKKQKARCIQHTGPRRSSGSNKLIINKLWDVDVTAQQSVKTRF